MTCILALEYVIENQSRVIMGGDSALVSGYDFFQTNESKVFINGDFIMGCAGNHRFGQILRYDFKPPENINDWKDRTCFMPEDMEYMVSKFIPSLRICLKDAGFMKVDNNKETAPEGWALIGYRGKIYSLYSDLQISSMVEKSRAIGVGADYALGALAALSSGIEPSQRILQALEISGQFCTGVRGPYNVMIN